MTLRVATTGTRLVLALGLLTVTGRAADASTIVIDQGMTFTLTNLGVVNDATLGSVYELVYRIDTNGWTGAANAFIGAVSIKPTSSALTLSNSALEGTTAPGSWTYYPTEQANQSGGGANCGGGGAGWLCAEESIPGLPNALIDGSTYSWTFLLKSNATLLTDIDAASIKAAYETCADGDCGPAGNTSRSITMGTPDLSEVPEPASLLLLSTGLAGIVAVARRRRGKPDA